MPSSDRILPFSKENNEAEGYLLSDAEDLQEPTDGFTANAWSNIWSRHRLYVYLQVGLIAAYTTVFCLFALRQSHCVVKYRDSLVYSPAQEALQYRKHRFDAELVIESPYIGDPTPEIDHAWHVLLENMNIAVPLADLAAIDTMSISVPDEPGMYVAGLSVYHELHCLKRLRQYTWIDYYFPNQTSEEKRLHRLHTDHCIDVLRQAITCRADVSLFSLQWSEAEPMPRADFSHEHECIDWDVLNAWAGERAVPREKMERLVHPLHEEIGPAFPDGRGSALGASEDHSPTVWEKTT